MQIAPTGEAFRDFIQLLGRTSAATDETEAHGMLTFLARPKYILRKLCFSILPRSTAARNAFVAELALTDVCVQQREAEKDDLVRLLCAICDNKPELARIPAHFCHKDGSY